MSGAASTGRERTPVASPFLDTEEAAAYLRVEVRTMVNWRWRGGGPAYRKHGVLVVYHVDDLEAWSRGKTQVDKPREPDE
jgi:hypothetical protein